MSKLSHYLIISVHESGMEVLFCVTRVPRADILKSFLKLQASSKLVATGQLGICKTGFPEGLSYQTLSTKYNTDLECTGKLQAFKKARSLRGLGIQARTYSRNVIS